MVGDYDVCFPIPPSNSPILRRPICMWPTNQTQFWHIYLEITSDRSKAVWGMPNASCFNKFVSSKGKKLFHLKIYIYEHVMNVLDVPCNVLWKILIHFQESWSKPAGQGGSLALSGQMQGWKKSWRGIMLAWQWDLLLFHLTVFCGVLLCSDCFLSTPPRWVVGRDQLLGKIIRRIISRSPSQ